MLISRGLLQCLRFYWSIFNSFVAIFRTFYKHVLGMHCDYHDIEAVEPDYYKSLKQILEFPLDMLGVELTFSAEVHNFGKIKVRNYFDSVYFTLLQLTLLYFTLLKLLYFLY